VNIVALCNIVVRHGKCLAHSDNLKAQLQNGNCPLFPLCSLGSLLDEPSNAGFPSLPWLRLVAMVKAIAPDDYKFLVANV
jgi:hypothetical protein